jgi:hypothetical protein
VLPWWEGADEAQSRCSFLISFVTLISFVMGTYPAMAALCRCPQDEQGELFIFCSLCSLLFWYGRTHPRNLTQPGPHSSTHAGTGTGNFRVIPVRIQKHFSQKKKRNSALVIRQKRCLSLPKCHKRVQKPTY